MGGNSSKGKVNTVKDEGTKRPGFEINPFTKYNKLASELRHHMLTYSSASTLASYSECSTLCNSEVQRFNTKPPENLLIKEENDGVMVQMCYSENRKIEKKFTFFESDNTMKMIREYILKYCKYVKQVTPCVEVNVKNWPMELMMMKPIANAQKFRVYVSKTIYKDFMNYFHNQDLSGKELSLFDCDEVADRVTIPADFFKSIVFHNLKIVNLFAKCEIESDDFINLEKSVIHLKSSISVDDIRAKVNKWNRDNHSERCIVGIRLPADDARVWKFYDIFPSEQFDAIRINNEDNNYMLSFLIGKVFVSIFRNDDRLLVLKFLKDL